MCLIHCLFTWILYPRFLLGCGIVCASAVGKFVFPGYLGNFCDWTVSKNGFLLFTVIRVFTMGSSVLGIDFFNLLQKTCLGLRNSHQVIIFHQLLNVVFAFVIFNFLFLVLQLRWTILVLRLWGFSTLESLFLAKVWGVRNKWLDLDWLACVFVNSILRSVGVRIAFAEEPRVVP